MKLERPDLRPEPGFIFKVIFVALVVALIAAIYTISSIFILTFGAIIVGAALTHLSHPIEQRLHIPHRLALAIATTGLFALFAIFLLAFGSSAADRFTALAARLPQAWISARTWLGEFGLGRWLLNFIDSLPDDAPTSLMRALPLAGGVLGWLANAGFILVIGIYMAADARTYTDGALMMLPPSRRDRARVILLAAGDDLRKWLIAMTLDMLFLGVVVSLGLWAVGVPFSFSLGAITGVAVFVPYIGPILSIIPGLLLALSVSPEHAVYALIVYTIALQLEGNITLPLLQRWTVHMPPAVTLLAIVGFGLLFGIWGVLLATPLAVVTMTIVRMAYVEDFLKAK